MASSELFPGMVEPLGILKSSSGWSFQTPVGKSRRLVTTGGRAAALLQGAPGKTAGSAPGPGPREVGEDHALTLQLCALKGEKKTKK